MEPEDWDVEEAESWSLEAGLIVEVPAAAAATLSAAAGVEPSDLVGLGVAGRILWVLQSGADEADAGLDDHIEAIAEELGDRLDAFAAAIAAAQGRVFLQVHLTPGEETPVLSLSPTSAHILVRLDAALRIEMSAR
jgi:hypothetical protein